ncbi:hypothetical protein H5410_000925 [Solanum commersonii]|uniref:Serine/threonine-protein phosphatase n=1 Tax=Solanum commersonii TaxID=4109 RepID=A0A9J6AXJ9_SOLCO|nr:hypothetical protein H5410_000925 [Solanum commersonii]
MDLDSSMAPEADQDPTVQNNGPTLVNKSSTAGESAPVETPTATPVAGPRCAPTYTAVQSVIEKKEDGPGPRCGHTLTAVPAVGEEGSPNYIGPRLILFGGATALEGNSAAAAAPSSPGGAGIRLAGATADVHSYDVLTNKWSRITPIGEPPTPRAAHVATAVGTMVVIQGGIGPAGLSAEDLHVLDLTQQHRPRWHRVVVQGPGPGPRYGHVMALVGQRYLMAIGGNDGKRPLADVWALDTAAKPYEWRKLEPEGEGPPPCIYPTERTNGNRITGAMAEFSKWINEMELFDPPLFGGSYTWRRGENYMSASRIDKFLFCSQWEELFLQIKQNLLPNVGSDHRPIMLVCGDWKIKKSYFKFEQWWLGVEGFKDKVRVWWASFQVSGTPAFILATKLKLLKDKLKEWNRENNTHFDKCSSGLASHICDAPIPYSNKRGQEVGPIRKKFALVWEQGGKGISFGRMEDCTITQGGWWFSSQESETKLQNDCLLMKWLWRFNGNEHALWKEGFFILPITSGGVCGDLAGYATASARSDGLLLLCGGRDANSVPLASAYGLAKHRDGRWEWAIAPGVSPSPRYQHAAVFVNARLHVSGGALGGGRMVEDSSSIAVLDTAAGVWCDIKSVVTSPRTGRYSADAAGGDAAVELTRRCRHAAAAVGDLVFMYGGLRGGVLLDDLLVAEDLAAAETTSAASHAAAAAAASNVQDGRITGRYGFGDERTRQTVPEEVNDGSVILGSPVAPPVNGDMFTDISTENAVLQGCRKLGKGVEYLVEASAAEAEAITAALAAAKARQQGNGEVELPDRDRGAEATPSGEEEPTLIKPDSNNSTPTGVRLHHRAVVVAAETGGALGGMVRQLSIDQFENEGRRVSYGTPENVTAARKLLDRQMSVNSVPKKVIAHLLKPRGWKPPVRRQFFLDCNEIADLCDSAERIFSSEPSVLQLRAPIKIFGDLHGQFGDLMRLFDEYGSPSTAGDIA